MASLIVSSTDETPRVYKEGTLLKRARGLKNRKNLKWQERFCRLTSVSLDYYDPKKKTEVKGQFKLEQINIVEIIAYGLFDKLKGHAFQIGDLIEVMYFAAKSPIERNEWMEAFRLAAIDKGNELLLKHHPGVYSLTNKDRWSCCGSSRRECEGCASSRGALKMLGHSVDIKKERALTTPMDFIGVGDSPSSSPIRKSREDLSSSVQSDASDTTITDTHEESGITRRTYTISTTDRSSRIPTGATVNGVRSSKIMSTSVPITTVTTPSSTVTTTATVKVRTQSVCDTLEEEEEEGEGVSPLRGDDNKDTTPRPMVPPQIDDITRSGASSPALSTDSGRGTSSRPRSMDTTEGENLPSTPHSTRSTFTNITTDSDPTRLHETVLRRNIDSCSIFSDVSGTSGYSGSPSVHSTMSRIRRNARPQSVVIVKDNVIMHVESTDSTVETSLAKLHQACKDGIVDIVRDELDTGAPINGQEIFNGLPMLPLFIAFHYDHRHIVMFLLQHGADPNALDMSIKSCLLHLACQRGCYDIVEYLIKYKADVNMRDYEDNTPLCEASKNGHKEIVQLLINNEAILDSPGISHTPLHHAAAGGYNDIVSLLLTHNANILRKTSQGQTPYHLAFDNNHIDIMSTLQSVLPSPHRPYQLVDVTVLLSQQVIASMTFLEGNKFGSCSWDGFARLWSITDEDKPTLDREFRLSEGAISLSYYSPFLVIGSSSIQVIDITSNDYEWRRTVADDSSDDENLIDPPLHLVSYCPNGLLATGGVESNIVKIWPPTDKGTVINEPHDVIRMQEKPNETGAIRKLVVSPCIDARWLGVVIQPGPLLVPEGNQKVHIYNMKEKKTYHILDTGRGGLTFNVHIAFSPDGEHLLIGFGDKLTKWDCETGDNIRSIPGFNKDDEISALCYTPTGEHIAVGVASGDIHIINAESGALVFKLRDRTELYPCTVTSLSYSLDGNYLISGDRKGKIRLWKVFN